MNFYKNKYLALMLAATLALAPGVAASSLPKPLAIDNRIRTYIHSPFQVYELEMGHGLQSYIEFGNGEKIQVVAMGDYVSWRMRNTPRRIFLRPMQRQGRTNLLVITNKNSYVFDLIARPPESENVIYIARFYHPEHKDELGDLGYPSGNPDDVVNEQSLASDIKDAKSKQKNESIRYRSVNHEYGIEGDSDIRPIEIFNTEKVTFIKFPQNYSKMPPKVYKVNEDNSETALDMFFYNGYIVVEGLHKNLTLRFKDKKVRLYTNKI